MSPSWRSPIVTDLSEKHIEKGIEKESRREFHGGFVWLDYMVTKKKRRVKRTAIAATMMSFFLNFPVARVISV